MGNRFSEFLKDTYLASASDYALACFDAICETLSHAGYELRRIPIMDDYPEIRARHDIILSAEAAQIYEYWFEKYENFYSPKFIDLIKRGQTVTNSQLETALEARDKFRTKITQIMDSNNIDYNGEPKI